MKFLLTGILVLFTGLMLAGANTSVSVFIGFIGFSAACTYVVMLITEDPMFVKDSSAKNAAFTKIIKSINSCVTTKQLSSCSKMVSNFENLFKKDFPLMSESDSLTYLIKVRNGYLQR